MGKNPPLDSLIRDLIWNSEHQTDPEIRAAFRRLLWKARWAQMTEEDLIAELEQIQVRNPAFPGDMMGYPQDDVDEMNADDDDEDDEHPKRHRPNKFQ